MKLHLLPYFLLILHPRCNKKGKEREREREKSATENSLETCYLTLRESRASSLFLLKYFALICCFIYKH